MAKKPARDRVDRYLNPTPRYRIKSPKLYYRYKTIEFFLSRLRKLRNGVEIRRHTTLSRDAYEQYDDWEMRIYESGQTYTCNHGRMEMVAFREIRQAYLAPIIAQIEQLLQAEPGRRITVLEAGCGNGTNLMLLNAHFDDRVALAGIDISPQRLEQGRRYWGDRLDGVEMRVDSATTLAGYEDDSVDLVYSVHCLEQLPYHVHDAVAAMARVARHRIVFVEPTYEYANTAQRLYAILGDQLRTLMPEVRAAGLEIIETYPVEVLANPLNKTGVIVAVPAGKAR